jgi:hypothetical protein
MELPGHATRRCFLQGASFATAGVALCPRSIVAALATDAARKGKRCIILWMSGGVSHLDTFDMKPEAPAEIRGVFKPIKTKVPGITICELLPLLARQTDRLAIIRGMTHGCSSHRDASYLMHTGYLRKAHCPHAELGSMLARNASRPELPRFIRISPMADISDESFCPGAGYLGPAYQPWRLPSYKAACEAMPKLLGDMADKDLKRYGVGEFGASCLAARRLIEAGMPFVEVQQLGYDLHADNFGGLRKLLPALDMAWAALLDDLDDRGLLKDTLVAWMSEFGRTPRINGQAGRDHWAQAWSLVLAGAGVSGGRIHGATNQSGSEVTEHAVRPADLFCTLHTALGLDPTAIHTVGTQGLRSTPEGATPIKAILN